jgi:hypothetical protein
LVQIIILLLIPARIWILPQLFEPEELRLLDAPTASPFTMESVSGNYTQVLEDLMEATDAFDGKESEKTSPPTEEDDEAERGEALGFSELLAQGRTHSQSSRRRSLRRASLDPDHIELASLRSHNLHKKPSNRSHND